LSGDCIDRVSNTNFSTFFITDTIHHNNLPSFIKVIPIYELISEALKTRV
jgi:phosphoribosylpyrophosphate synthetase